MRILLRSLMILMLACGARPAQAGGPHVDAVWEETGLRELLFTPLPADTTQLKGEDQRLIGSALAVLLGPFGAHRLYLGTTPRVAVVYGLTFGGFGVLALIDVGHLLFTPDLTPYRDNGRVFMWGEGGRRVTPP